MINPKSPKGEAPAPVAFVVNKGEESVLTSMDRELGSILKRQQTRKQALESLAASPEETRGQLSPSTRSGPIEPTVSFEVLEELVLQNSILPPLVAAMKANVDGTGAEIEPRDPITEEDEAKERDEDSDEDSGKIPSFLKKADGEDADGEEAVSFEQQEDRKKDIEDFFKEPWPGESFLTQRLAIRDDVEKVGNGYLEGIRNPEGQLIATRHLDGKNIRLVRLDDPTPVTKTLRRFGADVELQFNIRERRYFQSVAKKKVWFKEWGASRDLDRDTGEWAKPGEKLPSEKRANEVLHFTGIEDIFTPYGLPRWLSNAPSVVGSRKAEEFNLDFFDAGGIPPLLIIVQGGKLATGAEQMLRDHFTASGPGRHQAAVMEAYGGGSVDEADRVKVTVERFGSERQADSMFENYVEKCDIRIRRAFRMPALFLGQTEDMNFATAFASYTVTEAQVFRPERLEFDEIVNLKIMPELPFGKDYLYRSVPLSAVDITQKLAGMELVKDIAGKKSILESVNEGLDLALEMPDEDEANASAAERMEDMQQELAVRGFGQSPGGGMPQSLPANQGGGNGAPPGTTPGAAQKDEPLTGLGSMASEVVDALLSGDISDVIPKLASLLPHQRNAIQKMLAAGIFEDVQEDPDGAAELAGGCLALALREHSDGG